MKINSITVTKFKRFTDVSIGPIPETTKLVVLAGPNGCGKSSLFEALHTWHNFAWKQVGGVWEQDYHVKQMGQGQVTWDQAVRINFHDPQPIDQDRKRKALYVRSAYRNDPEFQINQLTRSESVLQEARIRRLIDNDATVGRNYQRLAAQGLEALYETEDPETKIGEFRERTIGEIRSSLLTLFPNLELNSLGNPLTSGTFKFTKGKSSGFPYKNLSGGEKAVFDLLLDLVVKKQDFDDTVFCIDEPDAHMSTRLQAALLKELCQLVPDNSQLWIATHSIGMLRYARDMWRQDPSSVVFLDLDGKDFDEHQVLAPVEPDRAFWKRTLDVALDDLAAFVAPERVVICEGRPRDGRQSGNVSIDADCFDIIFEREFPETRFLSAGNAAAVEHDHLALLQAISALIEGAEIIRIIDRDDRSEGEVAELRSKGVKVLSRRNLECYLFDDEVLCALCEKMGQTEKCANLLFEKASLVAELPKRGLPQDDIKRVAGKIYNAIKRGLQLTAGGNNWRTFMRDTLAPLITRDMCVYQELKRDIFD